MMFLVNMTNYSFQIELLKVRIEAEAKDTYKI